MNTQQIKAFLTISDCESFTEAAKMLYTTQSTLSKTIKSLENELDVVLFARKGNKVSLTKAGTIAKEYFAFISYSSKDTAWGKKLQKKLDGLVVLLKDIYSLPEEISAFLLIGQGPVVPVIGQAQENLSRRYLRDGVI